MRRMREALRCAAWVLVGAGCCAPGAGEVVGAGMHHLRAGAGGREWDTFPEAAEGKEWVVSFEAKGAAGERTLR